MLGLHLGGWSYWKGCRRGLRIESERMQFFTEKSCSGIYCTRLLKNSKCNSQKHMHASHQEEFSAYMHKHIRDISQVISAGLLSEFMFQQRDVLSSCQPCDLWHVCSQWKNTLGTVIKQSGVRQKGRLDDPLPWELWVSWIVIATQVATRSAQEWQEEEEANQEAEET